MAAFARPAPETAGATCELTFGQLSLWRDIAMDDPERWHDANGVMVIDLPRPASRSAVTAAIRRLDAKHESLRTVYPTDEHGEPRQRLLPPLATEPEIELVPVAGEQLEAVSLRLAKRPIDIRTERPWQVVGVLDPRRGGGRNDPETPIIERLLVLRHHIAADGAGSALLSGELRALLAGIGTELPPAPDSLCDIAREQRHSRRWQERSAAVERHFRHFFGQPVSRLAEQDPRWPPAEVALESRRLHQAAHRLAERHDVSPATVFTAAYARALAEHCDSQPIRLGLHSSNRFAERWDHLITSMNQLAPILVEIEPGQQLGERLAQVQRSAMRAYRLGMYDPDRMRPEALGLDPAEVAEQLICRFNYQVAAGSGRPDADADADEPTIRWRAVTKRFDVPAYLRVWDADDRTELELLTCELPEHTVAAMLDSMYQSVLSAI